MPDTPTIHPIVTVGVRPESNAVAVILSPVFQLASPEDRKAMMAGAVAGLQEMERRLAAAGYRMPADAEGKAN